MELLRKTTKRGRKLLFSFPAVGAVRYSPIGVHIRTQTRQQQKAATQSDFLLITHFLECSTPTTHYEYFPPSVVCGGGNRRTEIVFLVICASTVYDYSLSIHTYIRTGEEIPFPVVIWIQITRRHEAKRKTPKICETHSHRAPTLTRCSELRLLPRPAVKSLRLEEYPRTRYYQRTVPVAVTVVLVAAQLTARRSTGVTCWQRANERNPLEEKSKQSTHGFPRR